MLKEKSLSLIILNLLLTITIIFSEYVYSSHFDIFSWYENCGTQFLAIIIISVPILIVLSLIYYRLGKKGIVTGLNKNLPIIALMVFLLPLLLDLSLSDVLITIGFILGGILLLVSIFINIKYIIKK